MGRSFGVFGSASYATTGFNYGVYGYLGGSSNGAGVFGSTSTNAYYGINTGGRYAGYFYGDVMITGDAWVDGSTLVTSDITLKKEIQTLEKGNSEKLQEINAIKYKLKTPIEVMDEKGTRPDTLKTFTLSPEEEALYERERIGLSAQELQSVYPELVIEGQDGTLGVDYIGLIPVLLEAFKEQKDEIAQLQAQIEELKKNE